jgi:hypothetical protein
MRSGRTSASGCSTTAAGIALGVMKRMAAGLISDRKRRESLWHPVARVFGEQRYQCCMGFGAIIRL